MNEKLLEQKAREYWELYLNNDNDRRTYPKVCSDFAEQETKLLSEHIRELQKTNGSLTDRVNELETRCNELFFQVNEQVTQIEELKNRNAELKGKYTYSAREVATYKQFCEQKDKQIKELEAQIEKMKCCENCKNEGDYKEPYRYGTGWCNICKRNKVAKGNFDKWELED